MFYSNISVLKPTNSVVYPSNHYVYFTTEKVYLKDKKHNQNKRVLIGKMIDNQNMNPNDNARQFFPEWFESLERPILSDTITVGVRCIMDKVLESIELDKLIDGVFEEKASLLKDLILYMLVEETTVFQHFQSLMRRYSIYSNRVYSDSTISKSLKEVFTEKNRKLLLEGWNMIQNKEAIYLSHDSTNLNNYSEGVTLSEFGKAKDDDTVPIVNLSYVINQEKGTPLFYELYPGNIIDNSQMSYMIERAKEYGYEKIGIILDRGYFSGANLKKLEEAGYDVVMMIKTNQKVVSELIEKNRYRINDNMSCYISEHELFGKTEKCKLYNNQRDHYVHIYYSPTKAWEQKNQFLKKYATLEEELKKKTEESKLLRKEDLTRYEKAFKIKFDDNEYYQSYRKNEKKLQNELNIMGYFAIVTSKEMSAKEALDIYRDRDIVEKLFRSLKDDIGYNRFRVHTDESVEAKTFICFMANIVRNEIYQRTKLLRLKNRKDYTIPAIINELNEIEVTKNQKDKYIRKYGLTKKQKEIMKCFGLSEENINAYVKQINL